MVFTPQNEDRSIRLEMDIEVLSGNPLRRGLGFRGVVADKKTGKRYKVYGAACNLPHCQCDAIVKEITE